MSDHILFTCPRPSASTIRRRQASVRGLFPRLVDLIPEGRSGNVEIKHCRPTEEECAGEWATGLDLWIPGEPYSQLNIDGVGWMHDTLAERLKNCRIATSATGDVLIAGLGLGMIIHPILARPEVRSVRVLEINPHVAALVMPSLSGAAGREKLALEMADASAWQPPTGMQFDTIWLDCIPWWARDRRFVQIAEQWMARYRPWLREGGIIDHWALLEALEGLLRPVERVCVHLDGDAPWSSNWRELLATARAAAPAAEGMQP